MERGGAAARSGVVGVTLLAEADAARPSTPAAAEASPVEAWTLLLGAVGCAGV
jgi:hypothetical protein